MKKLFTILSLVILLIFAGVYLPKLGTKTTSGETLSEEDLLIQDLNTDQSLKKMNKEIKKSSEAVKIDKNTAIEKAKQYLGYYSQNATKIKAAQIKISDNSINQIPGTTINPKNMSAWIINFSGLDFSFGGAPSAYGSETQPKSNTEMNVIIDANTGDEIEMFYYK